MVKIEGNWLIVNNIYGWYINERKRVCVFMELWYYVVIDFFVWIEDSIIELFMNWKGWVIFFLFGVL